MMDLPSGRALFKGESLDHWLSLLRSIHPRKSNEAGQVLDWVLGRVELIEDEVSELMSLGLTRQEAVTRAIKGKPPTLDGLHSDWCTRDQLQPDFPTVVSELLRALRSWFPWVRNWAAACLAHAGPLRSEVLPVLIRAIRDTSASVL